MTFIVHEFSGLGNQLFQYAAGRYYAQQHAARMVLAVDPTRFASSFGFPRPFLLRHFAITAPYREMNAAERLLPNLTRHARLGPVRARVEPVLDALHVQVIEEQVEQRFRFLPELPIAEKTSTVYLEGYWQVHNIADAIAERLRVELAFKEPPSGKNLALFRRIRSTPSAVSVHVRRGDFVVLPEGSRALTVRYYEEAIQRIKATVPDPTFFIFSDDMSFARTTFGADPSAVFVDNNDSLNAHEDLRLMSACRHHIIANSTFSWWGAWLNPNSDKVVFAPRKWMVADAPTYHDLLPPSWRLID